MKLSENRPSRMGGYVSPNSDTGTLAASGGGYVYTASDGSRNEFDSSGWATRNASSDGAAIVTFTYSGSDLHTITTADNAVTTVAYSSGLAQTFTSSAAGMGTKVVTVTYSGSDVATVFSTDSGTVTYTYSGSHKLTSLDSGLSQATFAYDSYGLVTGMTVGTGADAIRTQIAPVVQRGLGSLAVGSANAVTTDALGQSRQVVMDESGRTLGEQASNGARTAVMRDANGLVIATTDATANTTTLTRDGAGNVTEVENPDGSLATMTYAGNPHNSLLSSIDERGNQTTYAYDAYGRMTGTTNALGQQTTNTYDVVTGDLLTSTDANGNTTTYTYSGSRQLLTTTRADGGIETLTYDSFGFLATRTDALGHTTTFTNDAQGRTLVTQTPDGGLTTAVYDQASGLLLSTVTPGGVTTTYEYNSRGQQTRMTQGAGTALERSTLTTYDEVGRQTGSRDVMGNWTHYAYDAVGQLISTTDALGQTTQAVYDLSGRSIAGSNPVGQQSEQVYDNRGRVIASVDAQGNRTTSTYDMAGNRTVYQEANGNTVTTTYDELNRGYVVQTASGTTTTTFDAVGNVRTVIDAASNVTTYNYDVLNRQVSVVDALGNTTTTVYDLAGNVIATTNARGQTYTQVYDSMNRVVETISPDNEHTTTVYDVSGVMEKTINALNQTTTYLYDALDQMVGSINPLGQESTQILDAQGRAVVSIDASGKTYTNWFDQLGRGIGGVDGLGNTTRNYFDAAGRLIQSVDANGNETAYQYDNLGRLSVTIDPNGGRVTQAYDVNGNLTAYTDPLGNTTTFVYDTQNREIERIDALGNSLTYAYDSRNRMTSQTDRLGRRKDWTYDEVGRVLTETWVTGGSTVNVLTFAYDTNGNQTLAQDDDGTYTQTFDNQDRVETIDGLFGVSLTFQYDALSRRTWVEDSFGGVMSSVYDAAGRLEKRQFGGSSMATLTYERAYADNGEMLAARRYSDLSSTNLIGSTTYGYDAAHRLTNLQHKDGSGTNIAAYIMTFDAGGRITEENRNGTSVTYVYDTRSQLTQAGSDGYSYDDNGNRTMAGYSTGGMNQLLNDGTFTYTYDLEGNVATKSKGTGLETWFYGYDHNNRLLSVRKTSDGSTDTLTVTYAYDVFGNRVKEDKWASGPGLVTTKFVYLGQEVYLDLDNSDAVLMRYIQGDTADEMIVRIDGGNVVAWFLSDRLGSIRDIVDDGGTVIDSITYDAYGKITGETNSANRGNYGAFGYVFDSDTGFAIMPAGRPYSVDIGRFGGTDKLWDKGGLSNFYGYTGNNPTNATDPSGLLLFTFGKTATDRVLSRMMDKLWLPANPVLLPESKEWSPEGANPDSSGLYLIQIPAIGRSKVKYPQSTDFKGVNPEQMLKWLAAGGETGSRVFPTRSGDSWLDDVVRVMYSLTEHAVVYQGSDGRMYLRELDQYGDLTPTQRSEVSMLEGSSNIRKFLPAVPFLKGKWKVSLNVRIDAKDERGEALKDHAWIGYYKNENWYTISLSPRKGDMPFDLYWCDDHGPITASRSTWVTDPEIRIDKVPYNLTSHNCTHYATAAYLWIAWETDRVAAKVLREARLIPTDLRDAMARLLTNK